MTWYVVTAVTALLVGVGIGVDIGRTPSYDDKSWPNSWD